MHLERNPIECVFVCVSVCAVCVILISHIQSLILGHFESCDNIAGRNITNGQRAKALRL